MDPAGEARMVSSMTWRRASEGILITTKGRQKVSGVAHGKGVDMIKHIAFSGNSLSVNAVLYANQSWKKRLL